ncbi:MAG: hypothetical protein IPG58_14680 [Acidobacteria bacterium]|nr:hypothetical protein [Acidobacteriota bacterium]
MPITKDWPISLAVVLRSFEARLVTVEEASFRHIEDYESEIDDTFIAGLNVTHDHVYLVVRG